MKRQWITSFGIASALDDPLTDFPARRRVVSPFTDEAQTARELPAQTPVRRYHPPFKRRLRNEN